jgi:hypothetical protein
MYWKVVKETHLPCHQSKALKWSSTIDPNTMSRNIPPLSPKSQVKATSLLSSLSFSLSLGHLLDDGSGSGGPQAGESSSPATSLSGPLPPPSFHPSLSSTWFGAACARRQSRTACGAAARERKRSGGGTQVRHAWAERPAACADEQCGAARGVCG